MPKVENVITSYFARKNGVSAFSRGICLANSLIHPYLRFKLVLTLVRYQSFYIHYNISATVRDREMVYKDHL